MVAKQHISTYVTGSVLQRLRIYSWWFALEVVNANTHTLKLAAALHTFRIGIGLMDGGTLMHRSVSLRDIW